MDISTPMWDEDVLDCEIYERLIMGLEAGTIREKLPGVRYMHLISGYGDVSKAGGRAGIVISSIGRGAAIQEKDTLAVGTTSMDLRQRGVVNSTGGVQRVWSALVVGFVVLLRGSELARLRQNDFAIGRGERGECPAIS